MAKQIRFIQLELKNFAGIRKLDEKYGDITNLSGRNGEGKTTFGEAPSWIFFGTDLFGNRFNPSPTTYEFERVYAALTISVDGEEIKFAREINEKGTNVFYINDVPAKAKEYEAAVAELFSKEEFLSLYNPSYFFTQHWTKQREQVMKHTVPPAKSEVLAEMSRTNPEQKVKDIVHNPAAAKLDELTKKHSLDDLQKIHGGTGGQKAKLEKQHIAAQSRTNTLREQLERWPKPSDKFDIDQAKAESEQLRAQVDAIQATIDSAASINAQYTAMESRIESLQEQVGASAEKWPTLRDEPIQDTCRTCKQPLQADAVKAVTEDKELRMANYKEQHSRLVAKRKEAEAALKEMQWIDAGEHISKRNELEAKGDILQNAIHDYNNYHRIAADIDAAKRAENETLASLKESIFILDAIKAYRAKEAELQAEKVQSLFTRLKIRLFKYVKTTGEYEPDFSIQMDGKDYAALSTGEKIAAGLELTEVLFKQSELIVPTFIDGIGEYTGDIAVYGQLITARAVKGRELTIETEAIASA